ncbi:MAG: C40 family peptidase [Pseudomonadota bacterium]
MIIINQFNFPTRIFVAIALLAIGFLFCASAKADETSETTEPSGALVSLVTLEDISHRASDLALSAMGMIGIRYKFGGNSPESGLDCSGLVRYVFKESWGAILPRTAEEISHVGAQVETANLQPGDLVFYNTLRRSFSHVGIYLGDNKFVHSPSKGGKVRIESMDIAYWKKRFNGARRINNPDQK